MSLCMTGDQYVQKMMEWLQWGRKKLIEIVQVHAGRPRGTKNGHLPTSTWVIWWYLPPTLSLLCLCVSCLPVWCQDESSVGMSEESYLMFQNPHLCIFRLLFNHTVNSAMWAVTWGNIFLKPGTESLAISEMAKLSLKLNIYALWSISIFPPPVFLVFPWEAFERSCMSEHSLWVVFELNILCPKGPADLLLKTSWHSAITS